MDKYYHLQVKARAVSLRPSLSGTDVDLHIYVMRDEILDAVTSLLERVDAGDLDSILEQVKLRIRQENW